MRFPNAYKGVSKLFLAEILMLVSAVVGVVSAVMLLLAYQSDPAGLVEGTLVTAGVFSIILVVASIISIVAFIVNIIGLVQAMKDDGGFKIALVFTIIAIAFSIIASCVATMNPNLSSWMEFASTIFELAVFEYVVIGIMSLAEQLGDRKMVDYGSKMRLIISILYIVILVLRLFGRFNDGFAGVMTTVISILEIVLYIAYIIYLAKAKTMLSK